MEVSIAAVRLSPSMAAGATLVVLPGHPHLLAAARRSRSGIAYLARACSCEPFSSSDICPPVHSGLDAICGPARHGGSVEGFQFYATEKFDAMECALDCDYGFQLKTSSTRTQMPSWNQKHERRCFKHHL